MIDAVLRDLTAPQREAALHDGAVLALAGAGTGKTKTLTAGIACRILHHQVDPRRILGVTFTNKAAAEIRSRVDAVLDGHSYRPGWIGTFHGLAARMLRDQPEIAGLRPGFEILDAEDTKRMLRRILKTEGWDQDGEGIDKKALTKLANRIGKFKDSLLSPLAAEMEVERQISAPHDGRDRIDPHLMRNAVRVYREYQRQLRETNAADFGDLLLWPCLEMRRNEQYRMLWARQFDTVLVDEYQDINEAQYYWIRALDAGHNWLFAVGDDSQAIYGWRGADVRFIRRFQRDFPSALQVKLEDNFRSTGHILAAANAVIALDKGRIEKVLRPTKGDGVPIEIVPFNGPDDEASGIIAEMKRRAATGVPWHDMAILYRSNSLSRGFEEALMRQRVPYVIVGDVGFWQRKVIKDALALLRLCVSPDDRQSDEAFRRVCNVPARGLGDAMLARLEQEAQTRNCSLLQAVTTSALPPKARAGAIGLAEAVLTVASSFQKQTLADALFQILKLSGYHEALRKSGAEDAADDLENLRELIELASGFPDPRSLLDHAALASAAPGEDAGGSRVQLMTLHKAKGLEYAHVFLPAWEKGIFPGPFNEDSEEERRLAYVALTRGKERVAITYCGYRRGGGTNGPNDYITDIPASNRHRGWLHQAPPPVRSIRAPSFRVGMEALEIARML